MEITLTKGFVALIDDEDYNKVSAHKWHVDNNGYARTNIYEGGRKTSAPRLHRFVMDAPKGTFVDHVNGDKLDCRKDNLRFCTIAENSRNRNGRNKYKGVVPVSSGRFVARVRKDYKYVYAGTYDTQEEAAMAYNEKATELFGEYAKLNTIEEE